jgi:hypothetical protein
MRTIALLAALALGTALTQQAFACDWNKEARSSPVVVAECSSGNCATEQPSDETVIRQDPAECSSQNCATSAPVAPKAEAPATPATTTVACNTSGC